MFSMCVFRYSIRLCAEMWRPFLHTSYVDQAQDMPGAAPYTINATKAAAAVQAHADRLRCLWA